MRAVVQRVRHAQVRVADEIVGRIGPGMLILLGVLKGDDEAMAQRLAERIAHFRFFEDAQGRMNLSALQGVGPEPLGVLLVSQFTLAADGRKGRRPSFDQAEDPERARALIAHFAHRLESLGLAVEQGRFGAEMQVELCNDGPVTFALQEGA
ncbi:MAG: D-tyrosyl-tRNA(Tyr) deacylase [Planctomycetes bacterium]|nr:D-tyrosyl-tRNA(Tyr) deacylase [Planctomycetota bacterium]MCB9910327.1 D-tyrosyl-tRNA(Tyr) deacylase [Planctomycetota bacterium]MCB9912062.1 D-tyrosyl-tRNA(Tyr) deacylase [Planctomycetota bacterium]HPF13905.1 D-aminoacyl-tRNA deacylase [Planctomycetota bacterium]HRV81024.1 D-aminoacyl-tRNA deacylase [Planctomycetota bacterium]